MFWCYFIFFNGKILIKKKKKLVSENLFDGTPLLPAYHVLQNRKISSGLWSLACQLHSHSLTVATFSRSDIPQWLSAPREFPPSFIQVLGMMMFTEWWTWEERGGWHVVWPDLLTPLPVPMDQLCTPHFPKASGSLEDSNERWPWPWFDFGSVLFF